MEPNGLPSKTIAWICWLIAIKHKTKSQDESVRPIVKAKQSGALFTIIKVLGTKKRAEVLPKSPMAEGINYTLNHWEALNTYTCDGNLAIENNIAERAVRPFAIGRKTGCSLALIKMESR